MDIEGIVKPGKIGSYPEEDVTFLLKDISGLIEERETEDREESIQAGTHYSEMLPIEYQPTAAYMNLFHQALEQYAQKLALAAGIVARRIAERKGRNLVIVSLARAGTPVGILLKRYAETFLNTAIPHYSISIIRDRGIDENALLHILKQHPEAEIQFVDGWTGKGAITRELKTACLQFKERHGVALDEELAVLADPGYCVSIYGTREDFLIPSACLNATVSGLVSRTVLNKEYISETDFHGAKFYKELIHCDLSNVFIEAIVKEFPHVAADVEKGYREMEAEPSEVPPWLGLRDVERIQKDFEIDNVNLVKPGVGETTRVLLRRVPWKVLVRDLDDPRLEHIRLLAEDKGVPLEVYKDMSYTCCGLIKPIR